jgi:hypothetical protein
LSREFESYNVGRNLFLSKFCLESGLDDSIGPFFAEISQSLTQLGIHIESSNLTDAENIDEFLFEKLDEKEIALLTLGVAVGMVQSVLLSLSTEEESIPPLKQGKMKGTIELALQRIHIVLDELGLPEIAAPLVEHLKPLLNDFEQLRAYKGALLSDIHDFECKLKMKFEN